ncbi:ABC transporter ATP-binding protein [Luteolibacter pohnpeiensis]|uniref:ABC transporter ATP-binding protein n=1 Tax=Luteolibacter pohnpeiensis TaxID=454153 RepID=A0A934S960_9BACT|nr:ABC transporter ATP-binding protein [Luteolibacter pohnpeiensis]MBK1883156.1 ABC transporter ATP-binding protein [Luteolibacter pohnpeiensis]
MKRFLPYYQHLRAVKWPFAAGVISGLIYAVASGAGIPLMSKIVFPILFPSKKDKPELDGLQTFIHDRLSDLGHDKLLLIICLWIPLTFLIRAISGYANAYLINYSGLRVVEAIRVDLFVKLQTLPISFFKKNKSGDLLARLMSDTDILRQVIAGASSDLIKQPATLLSSMGFLVYLAWQNHSLFAAIIPLISIPICVLVIRSVGKKLAARAKQLQKKGGGLTAALSESLQSPLEIRAYNLQQRQIANFRLRIAEILRLALKVVRYKQAISPSIEVVASIGFAAAIYMGVKAGMVLEDFLGLFGALFMAYEPVKKLGMIHTLFSQGGASIERIEYILNEDDTLNEPETPITLPPLRKAIRFENVSFAYLDEPVLREVDLEIPFGQVVALVGPSGAGKSTFANLVPRFYDPGLGRITIDGIDLRSALKKDVRAQIAVVPQMPALFTGTIAENIRIGKLDATDEEVQAAARKAHAHEFILAQDKGYDTEVGERGESLSGGQRQRIAIARAFLKNAPILILDEATSALDSESEAMVQQALTELVKGRTTFIIAHRFSTITIADRVLVFNKGRIVADGSHAELRDTDPTYGAMLRSQMLSDTSTTEAIPAESVVQE